MPTIIIIIILIAAFISAGYYIYKKKKNGCCIGCSKCNHKNCHSGSCNKTVKK